MKNGAYLLSCVVIAAGLLLLQPAADADDHEVALTPDARQEELVSRSAQAPDPEATYLPSLRQSPPPQEALIPASGQASDLGVNLPPVRQSLPERDAVAPTLGQAPNPVATYAPSLRQSPPPQESAAPARGHYTRVAPWTSSPLSGPIAGAPLANFGAIEQGAVYRSAQPTEDNYKWLLSQGFKSIVSFRREKGDNSSEVLGLGFRNYLFLNVEDEREPSDEQAERFLNFVTDPQNQPVLTHCKVGLGRTGTMAALIRYAIDGWSMKDAIKEARLYRGGVDLVPSQLEWLNNWAAKHPPACHRPIPPAASNSP